MPVSVVKQYYLNPGGIDSAGTWRLDGGHHEERFHATPSGGQIWKCQGGQTTPCQGRRCHYLCALVCPYLPKR